MTALALKWVQTCRRHQQSQADSGVASLDEEELGVEWLMPDKFRFGASSL